MAPSPLVRLGLVVLAIPMSNVQLNQVQALNRELGKLCNSPPPQAEVVCRIHARLVRAL